MWLLLAIETAQSWAFLLHTAFEYSPSPTTSREIAEINKSAPCVQSGSHSNLKDTASFRPFGTTPERILASSRPRIRSAHFRDKELSARVALLTDWVPWFEHFVIDLWDVVFLSRSLAYCVVIGHDKKNRNGRLQVDDYVDQENAEKISSTRPPKQPMVATSVRWEELNRS